MLVTKISRKLLNFRVVMNGGSHHPPAYDWRDDHSVNTDFEQDSRMIGVPKATEYVYPHEDHRPRAWIYSHPDSYNQKDLTMNLVRGSPVGQISNLLEVPHTNYLEDIAHEFDYESQDLDFQAQTFKSQHFRKKGPFWMWMIAGTIPLWFCALQFFYQEWSDEDNYRYQRPPAFNYPNDQDTPDQETLANFYSPQYQELYDAGVVGEPFFTVKNGQKIYSKWAGVNKPMEVI